MVLVGIIIDGRTGSAVTIFFFFSRVLDFKHRDIMECCSIWFSINLCLLPLLWIELVCSQLSSLRYNGAQSFLILYSSTINWFVFCLHLADTVVNLLDNKEIGVLPNLNLIEQCGIYINVVCSTYEQSGHVYGQ